MQNPLRAPMDLREQRMYPELPQPIGGVRRVRLHAVNNCVQIAAFRALVVICKIVASFPGPQQKQQRAVSRFSVARPREQSFRSMRSQLGNRLGVRIRRRLR